jgi:hypothetical protein
MGGRGFPPAPPHIQRARGETRPSRLLRATNAPTFPRLEGPDAKPPADLGAAGRRAWAVGVTSGHLTVADRQALVSLCRTLDQATAYARAAAAAGPDRAITQGYQGMVVKLRALAGRFCRDLWLTPAGRGPAAERGPLDDLLL